MFERVCRTRRGLIWIRSRMGCRELRNKYALNATDQTAAGPAPSKSESHFVPGAPPSFPNSGTASSQSSTTANKGSPVDGKIRPSKSIHDFRRARDSNPSAIEHKRRGLFVGACDAAEFYRPESQEAGLCVQPNAGMKVEHPNIIRMHELISEAPARKSCTRESHRGASSPRARASHKHAL